MDFEKITLLLSNHRHPNHPAIPTTLTKHQIISLIRSSLSPNEPEDKLPSEISEALRELQARGEILAGTRNSYCIAPPRVLALEKDNLTGLLFQGDRAYLPLAHQVLKTEQSQDKIHLHPKIREFNRLKDKLSQVGIRFLTVADSTEGLPCPRKPAKAVLRSPWTENPFRITNWCCQGGIKQYVPRRDTSQKERWMSVSYEQLSNQSLLQLPTGEYLYFQDQEFYELEPDTAIMAMFYQDKETESPLKIIWDKPQGKLNLQGIILPSAYARWLWQLSKPDGDRYRTRYIQPLNQPLIETAFKRLGCVLI